jgi:predicted DNA-binding transcriptional regulator YafY
MSKREAIARYTLIINKLRKKPATFKEISSHLSRESELQDYDFNVSARTFQRDVADIRSLYFIDIVYDNKQGVYRIETDSKPDANNRMLEAFDTFHAMNIAGGLSQHIHFEKRRPQGTEHLYCLLHAVKNKVEITFTYHKFWDEEPSQRLVSPYALKEFENRWYILAKDSKDGEIKSFGLDRLTELVITSRKFELPADYNTEEYYRYCFGIMSPNREQPREVVLSFDPDQGKYIKTLPLHETQRVLIDTQEELRVKLTIYVTHDFIMELLSFGNNVKVLKPAALVKEIKEVHQRAVAQYNSK